MLVSPSFIQNLSVVWMVNGGEGEGNCRHTMDGNCSPTEIVMFRDSTELDSALVGTDTTSPARAATFSADGSQVSDLMEDVPPSAPLPSPASFSRLLEIPTFLIYLLMFSIGPCSTEKCMTPPFITEINEDFTRLLMVMLK